MVRHPSDPEVAGALRGLAERESRVRSGTGGADVSGAGGVDVFVRFWPRPATDVEPSAAAPELAASALAELRALIALPQDAAPARTVWVTRGAVAAVDEDTVPGLAQSVLWGLARSARTERRNSA